MLLARQFETVEGEKSGLCTEQSDYMVVTSIDCITSAYQSKFFNWLLTVTLFRLLSAMGSKPSKPESPSSVVHPTLVGRLPAPQPIEQIEPELMLYTESSFTEYSLLLNVSHTPQEAVRLIGQHLPARDDQSSDQQGQQQKQPQRMVILTHGFLTTKNVSWLHQLKDAILTIDRNGKWHGQVVLILGWGGGADIGLRQYPQAAANALEVGRWLGDILLELRRVYPVDSLTTYAVGHSLGAHLLGAAGKRSEGTALDRITGLDPAGVGFQTEDNADHRLAPTDARLLVDVIHTDGQDVPYFGTLLPMGTIDFYPNYGWNQPTKDRTRDLKPDQSTETTLVIDNGSNNNVQRRRQKVPLPSPYGGQVSENHSRAIELFTWSVGNGRAFRSTLRLDGTPAVESAVHRVVTTGQNGTAEISVEMGYYADQYMDGLMAEAEAQCGSALKQKQENGVEDKDSKKYSDFAGCYYVHTNATPPWS